jgi:hypothetical protein
MSGDLNVLPTREHAERCLVPPNVGTKGEANGGMTGPENRKCTPYLGSGPGSTPLDLPLSDGLGGAGFVGDADQLYEKYEHSGTKT